MNDPASIEQRVTLQIRFIIIVNVVSIAISLAIRTQGWTLDLTEKQVEDYGGTLTMLLLVVGVISHIRARFKGPVHPGLIALMGAVPPAFAYLGGPVRYLITYHALAAMIHGFIVWNTHRWRHHLGEEPTDAWKAAPEEDADETGQREENERADGQAASDKDGQPAAGDESEKPPEERKGPSS